MLTALIDVIVKSLSFLYVQSFCWIWLVHKGVRLRLGKHWGTSRTSHLFFLWGCHFGSLCCALGGLYSQWLGHCGCGRPGSYYLFAG